MSRFRIISFNAEGLSSVKAEILGTLEADVLCLQETHISSQPMNIPGMHLISHHPSPIHGSVIYIRDPAIITNSCDLSENGIEILQIELEKMTVTSVYKPPATPFAWPSNQNIRNGMKPHLIIGDFNSHNTIWGYSNNNKDGEEVELWALNQGLTLLHDAKQKPSFLSARWRRGYNPDLAFVTSRHSNTFEKLVLDPVPRSQHRPLAIDIRPIIRPHMGKPIKRFNFRKANWAKFTSMLDAAINSINACPDNYETFKNHVWKSATASIPRSGRKQYIPCLTEQSKTLYSEYKQAYENDPFAEDTIEIGESLLSSIGSEKRDRWQELITGIDLTHNSKKAWKTIKKLNSESNTNTSIPETTPNKVAHQLLLNGKPNNKPRGYKKKLKEDTNKIMNESSTQFPPFSIEEVDAGIKTIKLGKAAGIDGITPEMVHHLGPRAREWITRLFNKCVITKKVPKVWKKTKVVALLKPGKDPKSPKSYRPISLLCVLYKLYERLIMTRISPIVDDQLSCDQAGFRPGRSCCGQVLNLTQFIEDGYENQLKTGAVFVDLTAAYDTVNHSDKMLKNTTIIKVLESLLNNRQYFVEMNSKKSRWRLQKNGLPQGSVLAPMLFNIYTNDQPQFRNIRRFIYADDLCIATQSKTFEIIENRLTEALSILSGYYKQWFLNANPGKTQVCTFHLNNHQANRILRVKWENEELENTKFPVYLGVTLDRTLSFKEHMRKLKEKVASRNNLLRKLANSKWGTDPNTLKTTAVALCFSTAEYCAPVWARSCHASAVDAELNQACRTITGNLKPTPLPAVYRMASIAPPAIRRDTLTRQERDKQLSGSRHPLYGHQQPPQRLKSRKSFATTNGLDGSNPAQHRLEQWEIWDRSTFHPTVPPPSESLPNGTSFKRNEWVALNRARAKVGRTQDNLHKWGLVPQPTCPCGEPIQTMDHILRECTLGPHCTDQDLLDANQSASQWCQWWHEKI
ncbi:hypothetical protein Pcinc_011924 [Petrolisthes cinctipes]|uniref:Reverse transcriptase domain-containing protein n=1 Tax=Petrolisthes cinctipes TaxID=88211 RepID=A0AAE1G055_PETCI|nr:hypothetical protein Pcinc_011924 [Petrolisthes cinctipes]